MAVLTFTPGSNPSVWLFNITFIYLGCDKLFLPFQPSPTMATQSKIARPQALATQSEKKGLRKRKVSSKVMDENFLGAETNAVTKRLKLSANALPAASRTAARRHASVEDVEDDDNILVNDSPKNPNALLEAVDGDDNIDMISSSDGDDKESNNDEDDEAEIEETAEAELGELI